MTRYHVEARTESGDVVLYLIRVHRDKHDGKFSSNFERRATWEQRRYAQRQLEFAKLRGRNRVHGKLNFTIVEEPDPEGA